MAMPLESVEYYTQGALKPACARRVHAVDRMLSDRQSSALCVPIAVIGIGGLLIALAALNFVMVLADLL